MRHFRRCFLLSFVAYFLMLISPLSAQLAPGNKFLFHLDLGENGEVFVAEQLQGRIKLTNLTNHPAWDGYPDWSPDGTHIVFASVREGRLALFVMDADGKNPVRLTPGEAFEPSWSPSGRKIAFSKKDGFVYTIDNQGENERRLTQGGMPVWSPSGEKIAFARNMNHAFNDIEICVIPVEGGEAVALTDSIGVRDWFPSWSPDGSQLAFVSERRKAQDMRIYVMDADGGNPRKLTAEDELWEFGPCWSPDGEWIAFFRMDTLNRIASLYIIHPDGEGERKLLSLPDLPGPARMSWFQPGFVCSAFKAYIVRHS